MEQRVKQAKADKVERQLLPGQSVALLKELHLVGRDGALHADSLRKLKQVNHLVQLLRPALEDIRARYKAPELLDAGAGNAYFGFVLYELFLRDEGAADALTCVEPRADLCERAKVRAARLGYARLRVVQATLEDAAKPGGALPERLHLVTALHACDTATDDALALAVRRNADHVAVVPCCQAEVSAQLKESPRAAPAPWPELWSHPLHRRELGAHLTNVIRALTLEAHGYVVTVTELTGWEHSLKNELILGRRVHKENYPAKQRLRALLAATGVRPKVVRELSPELLEAAPA